MASGELFNQKKLLERVGIAREVAMNAAHTARVGLDQILLDLEHRGYKVKESQDLIHELGRKVLERAERVREQIANKPFSPSWLREVSFAGESATNEARQEKFESEVDDFNFDSQPESMRQNFAGGEEVANAIEDDTAVEAVIATTASDEDLSTHIEIAEPIVEPISEASASMSEASISQPAEDMLPPHSKSATKSKLKTASKAAAKAARATPADSKKKARKSAAAEKTVSIKNSKTAAGATVKASKGKMKPAKIGKTAKGARSTK